MKQRQNLCHYCCILIKNSCYYLPWYCKKFQEFTISISHSGVIEKFIFGQWLWKPEFRPRYLFLTGNAVGKIVNIILQILLETADQKKQNKCLPYWCFVLILNMLMVYRVQTLHLPCGHLFVALPRLSVLQAEFV